jgi:altronate dehydratase
MGEELLKLLVEVASGNQTKAESLVNNRNGNARLQLV